jgi:hypothetical protein
LKVSGFVIVTSTGQFDVLASEVARNIRRVERTVAAEAGRDWDGMARHIERVFPRDDIDFVALVDAESLDATSPADLEVRLRTSYPEVIVRARDLAGDQTEVWYVYRDGSWTATSWD